MLRVPCTVVSYPLLCWTLTYEFSWRRNGESPDQLDGG